MVSSILRRNVWRFSELSSTKSSSCFFSPSLHLKAFQKHSNYKTEAVSEHIITLSTRPLHMVMGNDDYKSGNLAQFVIKTDWLQYCNSEAWLQSCAACMVAKLCGMAAKLCGMAAKLCSSGTCRACINLHFLCFLCFS